MASLRLVSVSCTATGVTYDGRELVRKPIGFSITRPSGRLFRRSLTFAPLHLRWPPDMIARDSATVFLGGLPAGRLTDQTAHTGAIVTGFQPCSSVDDERFGVTISPSLSGKILDYVEVPVLGVFVAVLSFNFCHPCCGGGCSNLSRDFTGAKWHYLDSP